MTPASSRPAVAPGFGQWSGGMYEVACAVCGTIALFMRASFVHEPYACRDCAERTPGAAAFAERGESRTPPAPRVPVLRKYYVMRSSRVAPVAVSTWSTLRALGGSS